MVARSATYYAAPALLMLSMMLTAGNWYLQPDRAWAWALTMLLIGCMSAPLLFVPRDKYDAARHDAGGSIRSGIAFMGLTLVIVLGVKLATAVGVVEDAELARRATMVMVGALFAVTGNRMPKTLTPLAALQCDAARVQAFQRFTGWTWVLTGLALALVWLLLPLDLAKPVSFVLLVSGMLTTMAQIVALRSSRRRESMTRQFGPALVLASALLVSEAIAVLTWDSTWMVAAGALLFALSLVGADVLVSRRAESAGPSGQSLLLAAAFLVACGITILADSRLLAIMIPILGGGAAIPVLLRAGDRRNVRTTRTAQ